MNWLQKQLNWLQLKQKFNNVLKNSKENIYTPHDLQSNFNSISSTILVFGLLSLRRKKSFNSGWLRFLLQFMQEAHSKTTSDHPFYIKLPFLIFIFLIYRVFVCTDILHILWQQNKTTSLFLPESAVFQTFHWEKQFVEWGMVTWIQLSPSRRMLGLYQTDC